MSFFEKAIRELWVVKGHKDGKGWMAKTARWKKALENVRTNTPNRKVKTLKEISKLTGYPASFLKALLDYERIEEVEQENEKKRNSLRGVQRTRK